MEGFGGDPEGWVVGGWIRLDFVGEVSCGAVEGAGGWCVCWASASTVTRVRRAMQALYGTFRSMYGAARHGNWELWCQRCRGWGR